MKTRRTTALLVVLVLLAISLLAGCGEGDSSADGGGSKSGVVEDAYILDDETGYYTIVIITENNSDKPVGDMVYEAKAYDKDGNTISPVKKMINNEEASYSICLATGSVDSGEKGAAYTKSIEFDPPFTILDRYENKPDRLEWKTVPYNAQVEKENYMALGITGFEYLGSIETSFYTDGGLTGKYSVTIENNNDIDFKYNSSDRLYYTDQGAYRVDIITVFRDEEGKIIDATSLYVAPETDGDIPANSEKTIEYYTNEECEPDNTPELYISTTYLGEDPAN